MAVMVPDSARLRPEAGQAARLFGPLGVALAIVASVLCAATTQIAPGVPLWAYGVIAVALIALRLWYEPHIRASDRLAPVIFVVHTLITLGLALLHPLYGFYTWMGYLDAARLFTGRALLAGLVGVACGTAASQAGGLRSAWASPLVFLVLVAFNTALPWMMTMLEHKREGEAARRVEAVELLLDAERENARLQARLTEQAREAGRLDERARLSREIHDTVAQGLVAVIRQLEAIGPGAPEPEWRARVDRAGESSRECLAEARRAVVALASPRLDDDSLPQALDHLVTTWAAGSGTVGRLVVDGEPRTGRHDAALLRICQEALANVSRHARAAQATATLSYGRDEVRLDVRDDGRGFDPGIVRSGHGLRGIRQRAADAGGTVDVEARPGQGCAISVAVPL